MWIVVKFKPKEYEILKDSISKIIGEMPEIYNPKVKLEKYVNNKLKVYKKYILNNYLICKHDKFNNHSLINLLRNSRGLNYFLEGFEYNQKELENFVKYCKSNSIKARSTRARPFLCPIFWAPHRLEGRAC